MDGAEWADPAAEHAAQNDRREEGDRRQEESRERGPRGDPRGHGEERVEVEENLHVADVIFSGEVRPEEEEDEQGEDRGLNRDAGELETPVFSRPFFFQRGASPSPSGPGLSGWRA